jgi:aspartate kinase
MALIIQKYGGTSVANIERIEAVAQRVVETAKQGNQLVVVVSAMSGETDKLIQLAHRINPSPSDREMDLLLSSGERVTCALTAMAIEQLGHRAFALTGRQFGIVTDSFHTKARIEKISGERAKELIQQGFIVVVAGFQGITNLDSVIYSDVTTLGRGGSDLSAVAVASALGADLCEIYTDVDGVYTADPNIVSNARKIERISYEEMLELASSGAKVLQTRSVQFAMKYRLPVVVRSSFNSNPGTLVTEEDQEMEKVVVSGVAYDRNQVRLTVLGVPDIPGVAGRLFQRISKSQILVDIIVQNASSDGKSADISFTVSKTDSKKALQLAQEIATEIGAQGVNLRDDVSKISIVGAGMRTHTGIAAEMFNTLSEYNINIMMISTSEIKISCIIDNKYTELAVRALHEKFGLSNCSTGISS